jgi:hypothetical protein
MSSDIDGILSSPIVCADAVTIDSFPKASQLLALQSNNSLDEAAAALSQSGCKAKSE